MRGEPEATHNTGVTSSKGVMRVKGKGLSGAYPGQKDRDFAATETQANFYDPLKEKGEEGTRLRSRSELKGKQKKKTPLYKKKA